MDGSSVSVFGTSSSSSRRDAASRLEQDLRAARGRHTASFGTAASSDPVASSGCKASSGAATPHVGIVGAGIAGLRCAAVLLRHGFRVTVLEGRHRLGGRMHQQRLGEGSSNGNGPLVDMGPNWIHGTKDNPIMDLVQATGSEAVNPEADPAMTGGVFDENGELMPLAAGEALSTTMWTIIEEAFAHSDRHSSTIDASESLLDFFQRRLPVHVPDSEPDHVARRRSVLQMAEMWGCFTGSPLQRQSLRYFWLEECIEGENLFCTGTYQKVLHKLAEPVVAGATILYGKTVTRVVGKEGQPASVAGKEGQPASVQVETKSGETLAFDHVVFTAPLGWLKQHHAATFEPPLPPRLCQAIASIGYGCLEKVYISFPVPFWRRPEDETAPKGRALRGLYQWLAPGRYSQAANPKGWPLEAVDLSAMPGPHAHATLLFYLFGEQSQAVTGRLAALEKEAEAAATDSQQRKRAFLADYFRPYYARLPHYDAAAPECQPVDCLATQWLQDDLAGNGSYSNFQVGLEAGDENVRVMREGLPDRGIWLAGEHTAPFVALGTATGAYWSGESVGRRIAEVLGRGRGEEGGAEEVKKETKEKKEEKEVKKETKEKEEKKDKAKSALWTPPVQADGVAG